MTLPKQSLTNDESSFAYSTARDRWPKIIKDCIADLEAQTQFDGAPIIEKFQQLLQDLLSDKKIVKFTDEEIKLDPDLKFYNEQFGDYSWLSGPWLYLECYMYRVIKLFFINAGHPDYDIFNNLKQSTLKLSDLGIIELSKKLLTFDFNLDESVKLTFFREFLDVSLWGNATDLSLLAGVVSLEEMQSIQGEKTRKENEKNIIVNDSPKLFKFLESHNKQFDIVLDNSGFELFSDLVFAIYLIKANLTKKVKFHCKQVPWFVSDVLPKDFDELFGELKNYDNEYVAGFLQTCQDYLKSGAFEIASHKFWTLPNYFWDIDQFPDLYEELKTADVLLFKGDLNYRKLTGDMHWPRTTKFETALQNLSTLGLPIVTLRTCKADVVVGLPEGKEDELKKVDPNWSATGKYAVVSFFQP